MSYPLSRYTDLLDAIEVKKKEFDPNQEVVVALIGGVNGNGSVGYLKPGQTHQKTKNIKDFGDRLAIEDDG